MKKFSKQDKGQSGGLYDTHIKIDLDFFSLKFYPQLMRISIRYFSKFFYDTGFNIFPNIGIYKASLLVETASLYTLYPSVLISPLATVELNHVSEIVSTSILFEIASSLSWIERAIFLNKRTFMCAIFNPKVVLHCLLVARGNGMTVKLSLFTPLPLRTGFLIASWPFCDVFLIEIFLEDRQT